MQGRELCWEFSKDLREAGKAGEVEANSRLRPIEQVRCWRCPGPVQLSLVITFSYGELQAHSPFLWPDAAIHCKRGFL